MSISTAQKANTFIICPFLALCFWTQHWPLGKNMPNSFLLYGFSVLINIHRITCMASLCLFPHLTYPAAYSNIKKRNKNFVIMFLKCFYRPQSGSSLPLGTKVNCDASLNIFIDCLSVFFMDNVSKPTMSTTELQDLVKYMLVSWIQPIWRKSER